MRPQSGAGFVAYPGDTAVGIAFQRAERLILFWTGRLFSTSKGCAHRCSVKAAGVAHPPKLHR